ncbi:hypothetical protein E2C01_099146 [Portunus trituberculatus]|uniref:Uncharacterized protein n=1 Tax=Portunus trituberculatus TaxID=210409 RepID=A0A5B7KG23_PORTR|nr:hypothetical protein [Portunus trituberculatus]
MFEEIICFRILISIMCTNPHKRTAGLEGHATPPPCTRLHQSCVPPPSLEVTVQLHISSDTYTESVHWHALLKATFGPKCHASIELYF